jgi:hypothetical protein
MFFGGFRGFAHFRGISGIVWAWMTLSVEALSGLAMDTPRYRWYFPARRGL